MKTTTKADTKGKSKKWTPTPTTLKTMKVSELKPAPYNPRKITEKAKAGLRSSIKRFGLVEPIIVNKRTGYVVGGHQRLDILKDIGAITTPVVEVDLASQEEKALNVALNNPSIAGEFTDALAGIIEGIKTFDASAFTELRLDVLARDLRISFAGDVPEDDVPELPKHPKHRSGDLIRMDDHLLYCGDSTDSNTLKRIIKAAGGPADMVFTDPPYGVQFGVANHNPRAKRWAGISNDELSGQKLYEFSVEWSKRLIDSCKPAAPVYVWSASMLSGYEILRAMKDAGLHIQSQLVWVKNTLVLGQADYQWRHEPCWYGWTPGKHHHWSGGRALTTVWDFKKDPNNSYQHPMQKPVALSAFAIKNSAPEGGGILDIFSGSGSTLMGCHATQRRFIGLEIDPAYCDVSIARWEKATGKKSVVERLA